MLEYFWGGKENNVAGVITNFLCDSILSSHYHVPRHCLEVINISGTMVTCTDRWCLYQYIH